VVERGRERMVMTRRRENMGELEGEGGVA